MKRMNYEPTIQMTTILGDPVPPNFFADGSLVTPSFPQLRFLLERLTDPKYPGQRQGIEAVEYVLAARAELRDQAKAANERGYWLMEDDRADSLKAVIMQPTGGYHPAIAHNLHPFLVAARDMKDVKEQKEAPKPRARENGQAQKDV